MIIYSAFIPHSPLLLSSVGKENTIKLQTTLDSIKTISEELYASNPDVLVIISSHGEIHPSAFSINLHKTYSVRFSDFGDLSTYEKFISDTETISSIQRKMRDENIPFTLDSNEELDYGVGVPTLLLAKFSKKPKILPVSHSLLSAKLHVQFGRSLKDVFSQSKKRIAIIASGDLSHGLSSDSPAGYIPEGTMFDELFVQSVQNGSLSQLLSIKPLIVERSAECSYRPLLILFGLLEKIPIRPELLSYEHPFGVGQLVVDFHVNI